VTAPASRRKRRVPPRDVARGLHARFGIEAPGEIEVDLIAWHCGARVLWREAGPADARAVISGSRAILAIAAHARGTPRARFSIAHELAHVLLHADYDALERLHAPSATLGPRERAIEFQADEFASELLVPERFGRPLCARVASPALADVDDVARDFRVSLSVAGRCWPKWTPAPCAFFEAIAKDDGGVLRRVVRSEGFGGIAVERRPLREGTLALELLRARRPVSLPARRVHTQWWGSALMEEAVVEECVPVAEGVVVGWLTHG